MGRLMIDQHPHPSDWIIGDCCKNDQTINGVNTVVTQSRKLMTSITGSCPICTSDSMYKVPAWLLPFKCFDIANNTYFIILFS